MLSYDLNQLGPTIGSSNSSGLPTQQNTEWKVLYSTGAAQTIALSFIIALSQEQSAVEGKGGGREGEIKGALDNPT